MKNSNQIQEPIVIKINPVILPGNNPKDKETVISHNKHPLCFGNNSVFNYNNYTPSPGTMQVETNGQIIQSYESFSVPTLLKLMPSR